MQRVMAAMKKEKKKKYERSGVKGESEANNGKISMWKNLTEAKMSMKKMKISVCERKCGEILSKAEMKWKLAYRNNERKYQ
jgi:hypothetical protein